jgi:hypothetical protein
MMNCCGLLALDVALSLAVTSAPANVNAIGVVTHAEWAHVGEGSASPGATIYIGDRLSTEEDGEIGVASGALRLQLESQSEVKLASMDGAAKGAALELLAGTLIFSTAQAVATEVRVDGAIIRPAGDGGTIAHVRVVGPKELRILARRGDLEFSYRGESERITEGACYRVLLDPDEADSVADSDASVKGAKTGHSLRPYAFIAIGAGAAAAALAAHHHPHPHESPHRP